MRKVIRKKALEKRISAIERQLESGKEEKEVFSSTWREVLKRFADDFNVNVSDLKAFNDESDKGNSSDDFVDPL